MKTDTICVQGGYEPKNGEARNIPIVQSTTFKYDSTQSVGELFDLKANGFFYTRISNPTTDAVEKKITQLEGGVGTMLTSSGMSATLLTVMTLASCGDHIISTNEIYGGTVNLFAVTLKKLGIQVSFVPTNDFTALINAIRPNTKAIFAESLANPALTVLDIEKTAEIAHKHNLPLIVDSTFTPPVMLKPLEHGADIIIHSSSKYLDGHGVALGGVIVDGGSFDYAASGRFSSFTEPDESYHGTVYARDFGKSAFIVKARVQGMRDVGASPSPFNAFLLNLGLETLHLRMERHCANAQQVAEFLASHPKVQKIKYSGLKTDADYALMQRYLKGKAGGVISFSLSSKEAAIRFMDALKLVGIVVHVADARTCVLHPASSTHRQLSDSQLKNAGIDAGMIRLSVGIEDASDIIEDIQNALKCV